ncbi:MAG: Tyrosine--tRNA ligase [candidate division WS6 bacterium OLB20]|uniref:Tyrosine--tRNA ligase n=1 Tax=candidate division WS6 bacterium OLB20 TaxID=1617426 RepID=A0A136LY30_9BACT|nr:MAG: Tyrosine--tRNA ligase [candidate division WS6 bacterium OLB20]
MLERDMFQVRMQENKPIYLHEFFYPLLQGYDSVHMEVSGEFGGRDQTFNMLAGRDLEKSMKGIDKFVITTHFLLAADGNNKMSKSIGNCIFIEDTPEDKYGKVMSIPDQLIRHYYEFATLLTREEIDTVLAQQTDPLEQKKQLAFEVTRLNDGEEAALNAQTHFEKTVQQKEMPEDVRTVARREIREIAATDSIQIKSLLTILELAESNSDAKRLVVAGGVEVDGERLTDPNHEISLSAVSTIRAGKRNWVQFTD